MRRTGSRLWLAVVLVAVLVLPGVASAASTVTGTITFDGKAPALKPLAMDADPACAKKHSTPAANEMLVLGSGNTMANILVFVSKGIPAGIRVTMVAGRTTSSAYAPSLDSPIAPRTFGHAAGLPA